MSQSIIFVSYLLYWWFQSESLITDGFYAKRDLCKLTWERHFHDPGLRVTQLGVACYSVGTAWRHWWWTFLKVEIFEVRTTNILSISSPKCLDTQYLTLFPLVFGSN
jgi:hypothetical protein